MRLQFLADESEPDRIDPVQRSEISRGVPPCSAVRREAAHFLGVDGGAGFAHGCDPRRCPGTPAEQAVTGKIEYAVVPANRQHGWRHRRESRACLPVPTVSLRGT